MFVLVRPGQDLNPDLKYPVYRLSNGLIFKACHLKGAPDHIRYKAILCNMLSSGDGELLIHPLLQFVLTMLAIA